MGRRRGGGRDTLLTRAQLNINRQVKAMYIDAGVNLTQCVSCLKFTHEIHAGHFISINDSRYLRFLPYNIHPQCHSCNIGKDGNLVPYGIYMNDRYGSNFIKLLHSLRGGYLGWDGWSVTDLEFIKGASLAEVIEAYYGGLVDSKLKSVK